MQLQRMSALLLPIAVALANGEVVADPAISPQQQRQYRICNARSAASTLHYRAITYDGFWGKGSHQYDVTLKQNDCSYPQNINEDYLKIWWEAYGSGSYILPTGNSLWFIDEKPSYLVMEYSQDPRDVQVSVKFALLYASATKSPGSTFDYDNKLHEGWTAQDSLTSITKASIDTSIEGVIEGFTPKLSSSVSSEVTNAVTVSNQASQDIEVKLHFDLANPVYLYQAQISVRAPGYGSITGFGGYFSTGEPLPPVSNALSLSQEPATDTIIV